MSPIAHVAVLVLLVLDLALGGSMIDRLGGRWATIGFEFAIILGYALFVLNLAPWRRGPPP